MQVKTVPMQSARKTKTKAIKNEKSLAWKCQGHQTTQRIFKWGEFISRDVNCRKDIRNESRKSAKEAECPADQCLRRKRKPYIRSKTNRKEKREIE